jgi:hypothetical protein
MKQNLGLLKLLLSFFVVDLDIVVNEFSLSDSIFLFFFYYYSFCFQALLYISDPTVTIASGRNNVALRAVSHQY